MFENIRHDFEVHGRRLTNRAFWALVAYRYGRWSLARQFAPWRWLTSKVYGLLKLGSEITTGVQMDRLVKVGPGLHIVHPGCLVIHPDVVIGARCTLLHNVTIGTNMKEGVPTIGDDVFIGAGACVLGAIQIGDGATIAANALVTKNVPAGMVAIGAPAQIRAPRASPPVASVGLHMGVETVQPRR